MIVDPAAAPVSGDNGMHTLHLSVAGGVTQFGAYIDTLQPGAWSSKRHWHEAEDEFVYVLEGTVTLRDDNGMQDLTAGDAVCWRHGDPNAHHLTNRSALPCRYLIVGSRVAGDICHYPDDGSKQVNGAKRWQVLAADGSVLREGDLPAELLNLPAVWGTPYDGLPMPRVLRATERQWTTDDNYSHPIVGGGLGPYSYQLLGEPGGLTQFGCHLEELAPGSRSCHRHWHEDEDELVYMLEGAVMLIEDQKTPLHPSDMAVWPAGHPTGHCLENRSHVPARYLVVGTRRQTDTIHYSDHDLITHKDGTARRYMHADGRPYIDALRNSP